MFLELTLTRPSFSALLTNEYLPETEESSFSLNIGDVLCKSFVSAGHYLEKVMCHAPLSRT